jgi:hypothetical protein
LEINGVKHTEFKTAKRANELFDAMVLDFVPDGEQPDNNDDDSDDNDE